MKKLLFTLVISVPFFYGCEQIEMDKDENSDTKTDSTIVENTAVDFPDTYIVLENDTLYKTGNSSSNSGTYRYQINFSSKEQLTSKSNDGNTSTTLAIAMAFKEKPSTSGVLPISSSRFITTDSINFYTSFFFNSGHENEGENFLSTKGSSFTYTIENGTFTAQLANLKMYDESSTSDTIMLNMAYFKFPW